MANQPKKYCTVLTPSVLQRVHVCTDPAFCCCGFHVHDVTTAWHPFTRKLWAHYWESLMSLRSMDPDEQLSQLLLMFFTFSVDWSIPQRISKIKTA